MSHSSENHYRSVEERIFSLYNSDEKFLEYRALKCLDKAENHYRYCLDFCRKNDKIAYKKLLPVVFKWIDDAYINFGIAIGKQNTGRFIEYKNDSFKNHLLVCQAELLSCKPSLKSGFYLWFHYPVKIEKNINGDFLHFGIMPPPIRHYLIHHLSYFCQDICFFPKFLALHYNCEKI